MTAPAEGTGGRVVPFERFREHQARRALGAQRLPVPPVEPSRTAAESGQTAVTGSRHEPEGGSK